jgi:DNA-binding transcriptional LysR family regulator
MRWEDDDTGLVMTNIPTELLRTLVAVVDLRSFTKAANSLGITQPAVSAQIKRLQALLGGELFDKSAPGVALTEKGQRVVQYARRLLAINDQIFGLTTQGNMPDRVRLGCPTDFLPEIVFKVTEEFRRKEPGFQLQAETDHSENLLRHFRQGEFDVVLALSDAAQSIQARYSWAEPLVWVGATEEAFEPEGPISVFGFGDHSLSRQLSLSVLEQAKQPHERVLIARSFQSMAAAASAGLGVFAFTRRMAATTHLAMCDRSSKLPRLPDLVAGIYVRNDVGHTAIDDLADSLLNALRPADAALRPLPRKAVAR